VEDELYWIPEHVLCEGRHLNARRRDERLTHFLFSVGSGRQSVLYSKDCVLSSNEITRMTCEDDDAY